MIGLLDVSETDRQALLRIAAGRLAWFPVIPSDLVPGWKIPRGSSAWLWLDPVTDLPREVATDDFVASVYRLQRAGLLGPTQPFSQVPFTPAGVRVVGFLNAEGWQPPDRRLIAIAATTRKAATRARKRRLA